MVLPLKKAALQVCILPPTSSWDMRFGLKGVSMIWAQVLHLISAPLPLPPELISLVLAASSPTPFSSPNPLSTSSPPLDCLFQLRLCFSSTCALFSTLPKVSAGIPGMHTGFLVSHTGSHQFNRDKNRAWLKAQMSRFQPRCFSGNPTRVPSVAAEMPPKYQWGCEALVPWRGIWCYEDTFNLSSHLISL